jgi:uncharacterized membrane protein YbaN (DUF454 family)
VWKTARLILGVTLLAAGVLGMILPIIPGIPLLLAGVALLGTNHPWVRPLMVRFRLWRRKWKRSP